MQFYVKSLINELFDSSLRRSMGAVLIVKQARLLGEQMLQSGAA